jgi:ethanolamine ammonia-lyase large subunit
MSFSCTVGGQRFVFKTTKEVLAKANEEKSGDQLAGIAAASDLERVAAKQVLAELTLETLRAEPVIPASKDEVTRLIDDSLDATAYDRIKDWTVSDLREYVLSTDSDKVAEIRRGLTGEMAAAVAKLMSNMDLIRGAQNCRVTATANTTLGKPGVLGARLQPNHPSDAVDGILASIYEGLSYGVGDAVIGINPVYDTPETVERLMRETNRVIEDLQVPTQNCILSHITTQMRAIERGAPAGLIFQSIAGCEGGNTAFGISISMLREAHQLGLENCNNAGKRPMYFETGQGSELSSRTHNDADQVTLEARCYALARCFNPFLVNDVCGFIGPEYLADGRQMIRAGLEDHFMGKLLGVPMGIDACYTNHMSADQNDLENLAVLLVSAGVNYFMGVPMGDDVMLSYQTTSYHDIAALREIFNCRPAPEFEAWMESRDLMHNGKLTANAGNPAYIYSLSRSPNRPNQQELQRQP